MLKYFCWVLENSTEEIPEELYIKLSDCLKKKHTEYNKKVFPKHVVDSVEGATIDTEAASLSTDELNDLTNGIFDLPLTIAESKNNGKGKRYKYYLLILFI